jgi:hypothetical protein
MHEVLHSGEVSDPIVAVNFFCVTMEMNLKGMGRTSIDEVCVYVVKDGKLYLSSFSLQ